MYNPVSTYRIQFNKDFTFKDFKKNLGYFTMLGPGSIYASPVFESTPGSMHGYDITNPLAINHEIGKYSEFVKISDTLKSKNIGWIQDIVPNHMAFNMHNQWLWDILENGISSPYKDFFDIDFSHPDFKGQLMIPVIGKKLTEAIADKEISIDWLNGNFIFRYFNYYFPFNSSSFIQVIIENIDNAPNDIHKLFKKYKLSERSIQNLHVNELSFLKKEISELSGQSSVGNFIQTIINSVNHNSKLIKTLLDEQHYQLCYWQESNTKINYRRFFTVNGLLCLRMENDNVFDQYHTCIMQLVSEKRVQGLRIDHIDGLREPVRYMEKLRAATHDDLYIVAEKILETNEDLLPDLPIQGTTGYDYLGTVNNLLTYNHNLNELDKFYRRITGVSESIEDIIIIKKRFILTHRMNGELDNLMRMFEESGLNSGSEVISGEEIKQAIGELLIEFPFYKIYSDYLPLSVHDEKIFKKVFRKSIKKNPLLFKPLKVLENVFITRNGYGPDQKENALAFYLRCMQFTGSLMAKGVEDTTMYYFNSFIAHNEVGDNPGSGGITIKEYHQRMITRYKNWPFSMNATSSHDTKRGEDVRARLNVISEMSDEWINKVSDWIKMNKKFKTQENGMLSPTVNEEYFIYQTLTGVFPFNGSADKGFLERLDLYLVKSLREAKTNSNWNEPDETYEKNVINFIHEILRSRKFLKSFIPFQQKISNYGIVNSLTQLMLKSTSPGIPDFYQGTELWDLSMVDPDNRNKVNYIERQKILAAMIRMNADNPDEFFNDIISNPADGRIKLWLTHILMKERESEPELFVHGKYIPLKIKGKYSDHILSFARNYNNTWYIVIVPLFLSLIPENKLKKSPGKVSWEDTRVILPENSPKIWHQALGTDERLFEKKIFLSELMEVPLPTFLKGRTEAPDRFAGILTHISSLPGRYGTGDMGTEAFGFVDFLKESGQTYWQILPLNPIDKGYGYSPYSSTSAFAGNLMFLSPDILLKNNFISDKNISRKKFTDSDRVNFKRAINLRSSILEEAFMKFKDRSRPFREKCFYEFCQKEAFWLNDYALFMLIKKLYKGNPWNSWPDKIKNRDSDTLNEIRVKYETEIEKEKFGQYLFNDQWIALKKYSNDNGIRIIGDMSFYVNYDSAEVWAHPEYFKLDISKRPLFVAGVPPDYFSSSGQLWNMPVYNWGNMKTNGFDWWINRIKRNLELCDCIRFDHFRGFSEYWEVPFGEATAINGSWMSGPGKSFFNKVKEEFPEMPFIAEDLGTIDDKVIKLRDHFSLPGMVVLHFAFGDNTPGSDYIPHNHVYNSLVYTGTHDNNTTKGWYLNEMSEKNKKEAEEYIGHNIEENICHEDFIRMAYSSVSRIAIIPIQDVLGLDERARLNRPSIAKENWMWKLKEKDISSDISGKLMNMIILFGRI